MIRPAPVLAALVLWGVVALPLAAADSWSMRWRSWADPEWGVAFRYPYEYAIPDQYRPVLLRERGGRRTSGIVIEPGKELSPEELRKLLRAQMSEPVKDWDVRCISATVAELGGSGDAVELGQRLIAKELGKDLPLSSWSYYEEDGARPHAHPKWAPEGIEGARGEGDGICAVVLRHGDRVSALACTGGLSEHANREILATFEAMKQERRDLVTWREYTCSKGNALGPDNSVVAARGYSRKDPVPWEQAFEIETAHYRVMAHTSPARALYFAGFLEALYDQFMAVYQPDRVPRFKQEIHIFKTQRDFARASGAHGIPVSGGVLGFFVPSLLSIFAYEDSIQLGTDASCESTLAHECSHQFLHAACNGSGHVPTWINEGLAVYFESMEYKNGRFSWKAPSTRLGILKQYYGQNQNEPLWSAEDYVKHYGHIPGVNYGEVYALTHFWVFGSGKTGKLKFKEYWTALRAGEDGTEAFDRIFMKDLIEKYGGRSRAFEVIDDALVQHVMKNRAEKQ